MCFQTALLTAVTRDSFAATEKEIFLALSRWCRQHDEAVDTQEVMAAVRLPLMTLTEMLNVVRPSGLVSPDDLLDAIKTRSESRNMDLNYRGMLSQCPEIIITVTFLVPLISPVCDFSPRGEHRHHEVWRSGSEGRAQISLAGRRHSELRPGPRLLQTSH